LLKTKDFKPDKSKATNILDLRPAIIAKLQQLIKDGSGGLYSLSVEKLDPDIISSKLDVLNGSIYADTTSIRQLDRLEKLPDDIFNIKFSSLHIDGIGIEDLLHKNKMDITSIYLTSPVIKVYHKNRPYNAKEKNGPHLTVYQRLMGEMNKIVIGKINIHHGTLIIHDDAKKNRATRFNDITIKMSDVLIDSSTQYDQNRFLFAKHASLETKNYVVPTPDSLYFIRLGSVSVTGEKHEITVLNAELKPRGNREQFEKKLKGREEMYHVILPKVILSDVNWWSLVNRENLRSKKFDVNGGIVSVYFDKSLPPGENQPMDHFPHQLVMMIPCPILVDKLNVHRLKVVYEQYNPKTKTTGTVLFTNINGEAKHVTNISAEIKKYPFTDFAGSGLFMNKVPMNVKFKFHLLKYRTGEFDAVVHMNKLNKEMVNPIAEPLGQFTVKTGEMQKGDVYIKGNNSKINATINFYYSDLHITPLKEDSAANGKLKKNHLKSFFANWVLIKNANPGSEFRQPEFSVDRDHHQNFISFIWTSIMTGIVKTIGVPVRMVIKEQ
jgi:hypothetical protein